MKKVFFLLLLIGFSLHNYAQQDVSTLKLKFEDNTHGALKKKSRSQRTAGILVGSAGTLLSFVGVLVWAEGYSSDYYWWETQDDSKVRAGEVMIIAGTVVALSSIPLFISSARNRRKADLILKNEKVMITPKLSNGQRLLSAGIVLNL